MSKLYPIAYWWTCTALVKSKGALCFDMMKPNYDMGQVLFDQRAHIINSHADLPIEFWALEKLSLSFYRMDLV